MRDLVPRLTPLFLFAALFSLAINTLLLAPSLYMLQVFDRVLATRSVETLLLLSLIAPTWSGARSTSGYQALFDGRASRMKSIDPLGGSGHQEQQPFVWDCLCYVHGNVKLVPDSRYGKAYRYSTDGSSWNGFGYDPGPNGGTSDLGQWRPQGLGRWDWYALAVKIPHSWRQPTWMSAQPAEPPACSSIARSQ